MALSIESPESTTAARPGADAATEQLMTRIHAEAAARAEQHQQVWQPVDHLALQPAPERIEEPRSLADSLPELDLRITDLRVSEDAHCREILRFSGETFVDIAYLAILKRAPEPEARQATVDFLRRGGSEYSVLAELLLSPEGLACGATLKGMGVALLRQRICRRLGLLGTILTRLSMPIDRMIIYFLRSSVGMEELTFIDEQRAGAIEHLAEYARASAEYTQSTNYAIREYLDRLADTTTSNLELLSRRSFQQLEILQRLTQQQDLLCRQGGQIDTLQTQVASLLEQSSSNTPKLELIAATSQQLELQVLTVRQDWHANRLSFDKFMQEMRTALAAEELPPDTQSQVTQTTAGLDSGNNKKTMLVNALNDHQDDELEAYYVAFEEACRGAREDIKQGMQHYLPYFEQLKSLPKIKEARVLDLGCGRGEWLELLGEQGWRAEGIDLSAIMVDVCTEYGLQANRTEAVSYLEQLDDNSLAAVTGFHIIEHLPFEVLFKLMREAMRTVKPGGLVLFETPNPENVLVGSHTFYHDFTHRNPVTPTAITFLTQYVGFTNSRIIRSHPYPEEARVPGNDPLTERVNGHLCGPQDFAIIAFKPLIDASGRLAE